MGLKILKDADGAPRKTWYGRVSVKGKKRETNLGVPIEGSVPMDAHGHIRLSAKGDPLFEKSRQAAQKAFEKWRREVQKDPAELQSKAYKARTGESLEGLPLAKLFEKWQGKKWHSKPTKGWTCSVKCWFEDFTTFAGAYAAKHGKRCETVNDITPELVAAWFNKIKGKWAWETVRKMMSLMRGMYEQHSTSGRANPFLGIVKHRRDEGQGRVPHKPLTIEETERLFECSRNDTAIYPLVVAAACTGMRIGDVCNLKWADVDLPKRLINCVTAKAGTQVWVPILDRLAAVLKEREPVPGDGRPPSPFVFPSAAARYRNNRTSLYEAVKPYFALAVFGNKPEAEPMTVAEDGADVQKHHPIDEAITAAGFIETKAKRILEVYHRFKAGERSSDIAAALNVARSQVSMDLREAEQLTGETLRPLATAKRNRKTRFDLIKLTRAKRDVGRLNASLYGWHSLRATFVVLAIHSGVPLEVVQKVVGHSATRTTMEYFNPEKKHAAEIMRQGLHNSVLDGPSGILKLEDANNPRVVAIPNNDLDKLVESLSPEQRKMLAARLQSERYRFSH